MAAEPPLGQLDPEDQDSDDDELEIGLMGETPKHFAVQVYLSLLATGTIPQRKNSRGGRVSVYRGGKGMAKARGSSPGHQEAKQSSLRLPTGSGEGKCKKEPGLERSCKDMTPAKPYLLPFAPPGDGISLFIHQVIN